MIKWLTGAAWAAATLMSIAVIPQAQAESILFWSGQAAPLPEAQAMRDGALKGFPGVDFEARESGPFITRLTAELKAGRGSIGLVGALHGDLAAYPDAWTDLSDLALPGIGTNPAFQELSKLGTAHQLYVPWMQATYLMAADRRALQYLPVGADIDALTYKQLVTWAKTMADKTGSPKFGFPAGPNGLKARFFQGFLLPAYTKSAVTRFRSTDAEAGWQMFRELWKYTNPASTNYDFMQEPLLNGDVWVAFDHIARLANAFNQRPNDFIAFPAPAGPKGRAFMPVIAGMAVPKNSPDPAAARRLIAYMLQPATQVATLVATNFFPVTDAALPTDLPASVKAIGPAINRMTSAPDALFALLPTGLGPLGGRFSQVYVDTFERIILNDQDIHQVLDQQAPVLRDIMVRAKASCWAPDAPSTGPCPVD